MSPSTELPRIVVMEVSMNTGWNSHFHILANGNVKYITVKCGTLDEESLDDMFFDFQKILPPLSYEDDAWKYACITRNPSTQQVEATLSSTYKPGVKMIWHPKMINFLDIECVEKLTLLAQESKLKTNPASEERMVAKMARFYWEIQYIEAETRMYQVLEGKDIAPKFLGHVHEDGRVIGLLLQKIPNGRNAELADLEICQAALRRFHALGFVHGDCNKYNFVIRPDGQVTLIDFDKAKACTDPTVMKAEMASLEGQLAETTGRGGGFLLVDGDDGFGEHR